MTFIMRSNITEGEEIPVACFSSFTYYADPSSTYAKSKKISELLWVEWDWDVHPEHIKFIEEMASKFKNLKISVEKKKLKFGKLSQGKPNTYFKENVKYVQRSEYKDLIDEYITIRIDFKDPSRFKKNFFEMLAFGYFSRFFSFHEYQKNAYTYYCTGNKRIVFKKEYLEHFQSNISEHLNKETIEELIIELNRFNKEHVFPSHKVTGVVLTVEDIKGLYDLSGANIPKRHLTHARLSDVILKYVRGQE